VAPETFTEKKYTSKVDVYSFGMILYVMLTGQIPFPNLLPMQVMWREQLPLSVCLFSLIVRCAPRVPCSSMPCPVPRALHCIVQVMMKVVLNKERPPLPRDSSNATVQALCQLIEVCWAHDEDARPDMETVMRALEKMKATLPNASASSSSSASASARANSGGGGGGADAKAPAAGAAAAAVLPKPNAPARRPQRPRPRPRPRALEAVAVVAEAAV
jgi:serine/threonine protein kinase